MSAAKSSVQDENGEDLFERIDWAVQEARESLDGAGSDAVREYLSQQDVRAVKRFQRTL